MNKMMRVRSCSFAIALAGAASCTGSIDYTLRIGFPDDVTEATFEGQQVQPGYTYTHEFADESEAASWRGVSVILVHNGIRYRAVVKRFACELQGLISEEVYWRFYWDAMDGFAYGPESGRCHNDSGTSEFSARLAP